MIAFLTPFADDGISYAFGYVFAGMNFVAVLMTYFFLFETRTLSLENIDLMYRTPELKAWSSAKWAPPGYINRTERDEAYFRQLADEAEQKEENMAHGDSSQEKSE